MSDSNNNRDTAKTSKHRSKNQGLVKVKPVFVIALLIFLVAYVFLKNQREYECHEFCVPLSVDAQPKHYLAGLEQVHAFRPVYAILFISDSNPANPTVVLNHGRLISIEGLSLNLSVYHKAVYALQPNLSLKELSLSDDEIDQVLIALNSKPPDVTFDLSPWEKITPDLNSFDFHRWPLTK
jgi:hypothetical protein